MTQPSILKGMRNLRDAQTSVMTTAPAQLGFVLERTSPTLYTLSVSIKKQLRFRKNWNLNWIVYFTCDQNVIFHILLWKGNEFCCNCGQRLPSNFISSSKITLNENPDLIPKKLTPYANTGTSCMEARCVFAFKGKNWIHAVHWDEWSEFTITAGTEVCLLQFPVGGFLIENRLNDELNYPVVFQHDFHGLHLS